MPVSDPPICFLFDNGSLRAASTLSLRVVARALQAEIGAPVEAVSLLHSSGVPAEELGGQAARLLEPALDAFLRSGGKDAVVLPLFFGPSAALTEYVPARLGALAAKWPRGRLRQARALVEIAQDEDKRVATALADGVRAVVSRRGLKRPAVLLVDHGSPQPEVTAVRELLGRQLRGLLDGMVSVVGTASMDRRDGEVYAFNEPLLERALRTAPFNAGDVVVALQFISPGRHAGPGGDVARICAVAERAQPGLTTHLTDPLGAHPAVIAVLAGRYREAVRRDSLVR